MSTICDTKSDESIAPVTLRYTTTRADILIDSERKRKQRTSLTWRLRKEDECRAGIGHSRYKKLLRSGVKQGFDTHLITPRFLYLRSSSSYSLPFVSFLPFLSLEKGWVKPQEQSPICAHSLPPYLTLILLRPSLSCSENASFNNVAKCFPLLNHVYKIQSVLRILCSRL